MISGGTPSNEILVASITPAWQHSRRRPFRARSAAQHELDARGVDARTGAHGL